MLALKNSVAAVKNAKKNLVNKNVVTEKVGTLCAKNSRRANNFMLRLTNFCAR